MKAGNINRYGRQLSDEEIRAGVHRRFVGGMWDEIGKLQLDFLVRAGLRPDHRLLDVGCGALRGGLHFIRYLDRGHYFGIDSNPSLVAAGRIELEAAGLSDREPTLCVDGAFDIARLGQTFDFALAVSLFTHLPMNHIVRCLAAVGGSLAPGGRLLATFFQAPHPACLSELVQQPGGITTRYDADPYHYAVAELSMLADLAGLDTQLIGEWGHPRGQRMIQFVRPGGVAEASG